MSVLTSRDNPRVRRWRELVRDARARRKAGRVLIEGEHLVQAFRAAGGRIEELILSKTGVEKFSGLSEKASVVLSDAVFRSIADTKTPAGIAA